MLRLRDERHAELDDLDEEMDPTRPAMTRADEITRDDAFPADDDPELDILEDGAGVGALRGLGIAAAAFVPTFLALFFGLSYLMAPAPARTASQPASVASALPGGGADPAATPSVSEMSRGRPGSGAPSAGIPWASDPSAGAPDNSPLGKRESAPRDPTEPSAAEPAPVPGEPSQRADQAPAAAAGEPSPPPATSLPPVSPRVPEPPRTATASRPAPERRPDPEPRPKADADTRPPAEAHRPPGDWTPAAAFAGREAAVRLAASIERQGYPVEIRQDGSATRPWVVWIGSQPSSGGAHRR